MASRRHLHTPASLSSAKNTASATVRSSILSARSHSLSCQKLAHRNSSRKGWPITDHAQRGMLAPSQLSPAFANVVEVYLHRKKHGLRNVSRSPTKQTGILSPLSITFGRIIRSLSQSSNLLASDSPPCFRHRKRTRPSTRRNSLRCRLRTVGGYSLH